MTRSMFPPSKTPKASSRVNLAMTAVDKGLNEASIPTSPEQETEPDQKKIKSSYCG